MVETFCGKYLESGEYWFTTEYGEHWCHGFSAPDDSFGFCKDYPGHYNNARRCPECALRMGLVW